MAAAYIKAYLNNQLDDPRIIKTTKLRERYLLYYSTMFIPSLILAATSLSIDNALFWASIVLVAVMCSLSQPINIVEEISAGVMLLSFFFGACRLCVHK